MVTPDVQLADIHEVAEREYTRMMILSSQYRQLGFGVLADRLRRNAIDALKWVARDRKEKRNA